MSVGPCMGGFCPLREKCLHYTDPAWRHSPPERKCVPGEERTMFFLQQQPKAEK